MRKSFLFAALVAGAASAQPVVPGFEAARGAGVTPGEWRYVATATGSQALFGNALELRCDRATRRVQLRRIAAGVALPIAAPMSIATDTAERTISADGWLDARDPLLDAIAFSRGRFVVVGGGERLILPSFPEAARSIQDCRI